MCIRDSKKTGEMKDGQTFRCLLVCTQDCSQYLAATLTMQGTNAKPLTEAVANFKKNKRFRMDKTRLKYGVQQQYIHTPVKVVVDMAGTRFDPLVSDGDGDAEQLAPEPPMSVADCVLLTQNQQFDVTALVEQIDPEREVNDQRVVREIVLVDGSKIQEKLQQLRLSFFYDRYPSAKDQAILKMLEDAAENAKPLILFAIQGKKNQKGYKFEASRDFFLTPAPTTTGKGSELALSAQALRATPQEERETFETTFSRKDYAPQQGTETNCALLQSMRANSNVKAIDDLSLIHI